MPSAIVNLGGEMLYILQQRLNAQNIPREKSLKVLEDIAKAMFNPSFTDSLFKPQDLYTLDAIRAIFDKIAHSSIMRLSTSSMDKLYDLMTMGLKHQVLTAGFAEDIQIVTLNHLHTIESMLEGGTQECLDLVRSVIEKARSHYMSLSALDFLHLRQALLNLLHGKRIKVSLFLQDGIQQPDGTFVFKTGEELREGVEIPGEIRAFDEDNKKRVLKLALPQATEYKPFTTPRKAYVKLGINLYSKYRKKRLEEDAPASAGTSASSSGPEKGTMEPSPVKRVKPANPEQAKAELNLLANLVGSAKPTASGDTFKLNFGADPGFATTEESTTKSAPTVKVLQFDGKTEGHLQEIMKGFSISESQEPKNDGDDLLDLMDSA